MGGPSQKSVGARGGARQHAVQSRIDDLIGASPLEERQQPHPSHQKKRKTAAGDTPPDKGRPGARGPAPAPGVVDPLTQPSSEATADDVIPEARAAERRDDVTPGGPVQPSPLLDQLIAEAVTAAVQKALQGFRTQLQKDFDELNNSLREHIKGIGTRVGDIETYLNDADDRIKTLEQKVKQRDDMIQGLCDQLDEMDSERRRNTLVFTGNGVPQVAGDRQYDEDVTGTVMDMVKTSFPTVRMDRGDVASCYRVGQKRTLVVQFVHHGRGSARDQLYQARFNLMKQTDSSKAIFVNESLSPRRREQLNILRTAKQNGKIYSVFTRDCAVYYKEKKGGANIRVSHEDQLRSLGGRG